MNLDDWYEKADSTILPEGCEQTFNGHYMSTADYLGVIAATGDPQFCCLNLTYYNQQLTEVAEGLYIHPNAIIEVDGVKGLRYRMGSSFSEITGLKVAEKYYHINKPNTPEETLEERWGINIAGRLRYYKGASYIFKDGAFPEHYIGGMNIVETKANLEFYGVIEWQGKTYSPHLYAYHSQERTAVNNAMDKTYRIGFEIEKENKALRNRIPAGYLYDRWRWIAESDSSLYNGYELVSPVYNMLNRSRIKKDVEALRNWIDGGDEDYYRNTGGHINVSIKDKSGKQVLKTIRGFASLLYAMYPERATGHYCGARKFDKYGDGGHYQAFYPKPHLLEIRVFPGVKTVEDLLQRYELVRYMLTQPAKSTITVINRLLDPTTRLHQLITDMGYEPQELAQEMLNQEQRWDNERYSEKVHKEVEAKGLKIKTIIKPSAKQAARLRKAYENFKNEVWFQALEPQSREQVLGIIEKNAEEKVY
jgi:hypothetical protein